MNNRDIEKHYMAACKVALNLIEKRARAIMRQHSNLVEFVSAMGIWSFTTKSGNDVDDTDLKYLAPVGKIYDEWDEYLKLSGEPMRFTAEGPVITDW